MKKLIFLLLICFFTFNINVKASDNLLKTEGKDKVMFIKDNDGSFLYSWSFDKDEYKKNEFEFDLGIEFTSDNKKEINDLIGETIEKKYVSFSYHGELPSTATIKVPVSDKFKDGEKLILYYYNPEKNIIEIIKSDVKVINGNVSFDIEHCSDYFLSKAVVKNAQGTNNGGIIIVGMVVVIVGLIGYTLMRNK